MRIATSFLIIIFGLFGAEVAGAAEGDWPAQLTNECSSPQAEWIWCDDFESNRSSGYFESDFNLQATMGVNNSVANAFHFASGASSGGSLKVAFGRTPGTYFKPVDDGISDYREIYWRMFVFVPSDWVGNGADKLSRATIFAGSNWSQAMIAHVWSGDDPGSTADQLFIDPASGTDTTGNLATSGYNDFANLRWLGRKSAAFKIFAKENFGRWHCVEAHVKLNDAGQSNGVFQLSINNQLEVESTSLNWVGNFSSYGINAVFFENYWNSGSPVAQTRYFDNLVISTQPIGCGTQGQTPKPPEDLSAN